MAYAVLIVEDETVLAKNIKTYLGRHDFEARIVTDSQQALDALDGFRPDVVLVDYNLPGMDGLSLIAEIRHREARLPIIMLTGHGGVEVAVNAMKSGASDYLSKPIALAELKLVLQRVLKVERMEGVLAHYQQRGSENGIAALVGESTPMQALRDTLARILEAERTLTDCDPPAVLITGETGTGKELIARALHFDGERRNRPFIEINCASIPASLLEAELFGYERGAFTDARERKPGLVEAAEGGTLFLDEIGEVELPVQAKLLKLLEEKRVRRLGGTRESKVDLRILAATNRDLDAMVREGRFRADLYYRLRILHVYAPPLREREGDVVLLARRFIKLHGDRYGKRSLALTFTAEQALRRYFWPGNVRELRNAVEQAVLLARAEALGPEAFPFCMGEPNRQPQVPAASFQTRASERGEPAFPDSGVKMYEVERDLLLQALVKTGWNITRAAKLLGLSRDTLRYRIEKYDLKSEE
jgi:two-component system, NtrC family, response regulator AtoC